MQQTAQSLFCQTGETTGARLPQFVRDQFDGFLGSAANLNIQLRCLVLDGAYWRTDGGPVFVEIQEPIDQEERWPAQRELESARVPPTGHCERSAAIRGSWIAARRSQLREKDHR